MLRVDFCVRDVSRNYISVPINWNEIAASSDTGELDETRAKLLTSERDSVYDEKFDDDSFQIARCWTGCSVYGSSAMKLLRRFTFVIQSIKSVMITWRYFGGWFLEGDVFIIEWGVVFINRYLKYSDNWGNRSPIIAKSIRGIRWEMYVHKFVLSIIVCSDVNKHHETHRVDKRFYIVLMHKKNYIL